MTTAADRQRDAHFRYLLSYQPPATDGGTGRVKNKMGDDRMNKLSAAAIQKILGNLDTISWVIARIEANVASHLEPYTQQIEQDVADIKTALLGASLTDVEVELPAEAVP
jgi:hypothetical protein